MRGHETETGARIIIFRVVANGGNDMWYFSWILGVLLACAFGIINVMWMETEEMLGNDKD